MLFLLDCGQMAPEDRGGRLALTWRKVRNRVCAVNWRIMPQDESVAQHCMTEDTSARAPEYPILCNEPGVHGGDLRLRRHAGRFPMAAQAGRSRTAPRPQRT